jgi:hypothetical protein
VHVRGTRSYEIDASVALARVLLGSAGPTRTAEIEAALARALEHQVPQFHLSNAISASERRRPSLCPVLNT